MGRQRASRYWGAETHDQESEPVPLMGIFWGLYGEWLYTSVIPPPLVSGWSLVGRRNHIGGGGSDFQACDPELTTYPTTTTTKKFLLLKTKMNKLRKTTFHKLILTKQVQIRLG